MPIGRQTHSGPLFTVTTFGLLVAACVMAVAVAAGQPRPQAVQCGRCGQAIPVRCQECGQRLPQENPSAARERPQPTPDEDGLDIVAPMIFGF